MRTPTVAAPGHKLEPPRHGASDHAPPGDAFSVLLDTQISARTAPAEGPHTIEPVSSPHEDPCGDDDGTSGGRDDVTTIADAATAAAATASVAIPGPAPAPDATPTTTPAVLSTDDTKPVPPSVTPTPANATATLTAPAADAPIAPTVPPAGTPAAPTAASPAAVALPAPDTAAAVAPAAAPPVAPTATPAEPATGDAPAPKGPRGPSSSSVRGDRPPTSEAPASTPTAAAATSAPPAPAAAPTPTSTTTTDEQVSTAPITIDAPSSLPSPWTVAPPSAAPTTQAPSAPVGVPVGPQLVDRIELLMTTAGRNGQAQARIQLHPAELGSVSVVLRHAADGLHATLTAHQADALAALTQTGDDLRRSLDSRGIVLAQLDIGLAADAGAQAGEQREARSNRRDLRPGATRADAIDPDEDLATVPALVPAPGALVDVIA